MIRYVYSLFILIFFNLGIYAQISFEKARDFYLNNGYTQKLYYSDTIIVFNKHFVVAELEIDSVLYYKADKNTSGKDYTSANGIFNQLDNGKILFTCFKASLRTDIKNEVAIVNLISSDQKLVYSFVFNRGELNLVTLFEREYKNWHGTDYILNPQKEKKNILLSEFSMFLIGDDNFFKINRLLDDNFVFLTKGIRTEEEIIYRIF